MEYAMQAILSAIKTLPQDRLQEADELYGVALHIYTHHTPCPEEWFDKVLQLLVSIPRLEEHLSTELEKTEARIKIFEALIR